MNSLEVKKFSENFSLCKDEWSEHDSQKRIDRQVICMESNSAESVRLSCSTTPWLTEITECAETVNAVKEKGIGGFW